MNNIYDYVIEQRAAFKKPISILDGWNWNFREHVRLSALYKNSQFERENEKRDKRPFRNIVRPILNIQYRTEGFDVKDIELYVDNPDTFYKSFLSQKFHEKWALEHAMDTFIDDLVESYVDYGGVLVKNVDGVRPEVVDLQTIEFCDQSDMLANPFAIKHNFSPTKLREKTKWGDPKKGATIDIETLITLSEQEKESADGYENDTTGKNIEIYEVHGTFPDSWVRRDDSEESKYTQQIHIIAYYKDRSGKENGVTLFSSREPVLPFKLLLRDKINGRALGFGGVEELFEAQVWTNYSEVQMREMLELASKIFFKTTDPRFKNKNSLRDAPSGQVFDLQNGTDLQQVDNVPRNINIFENAISKWEEHAQRIGAAGDILQGEAPSAGTPFKSVEAQLIENKSLHQWRQGKIAVFFEEIYREWVLPYIRKEIVKDQTFLAELSAEEMLSVSTKLVDNLLNKKIADEILNGNIITREQAIAAREVVVAEFMESGRKKFMKLLKKDFDGEPLSVRTNIKGKQKDLSLITDKVVNVLRQFIATPEIRQDPEMVKLLNVILESSGLSPMVYGPSMAPRKQEGSASSQPLKELAEAQA